MAPCKTRIWLMKCCCLAKGIKFIIIWIDISVWLEWHFPLYCLWKEEKNTTVSIITILYFLYVLCTLLNVCIASLSKHILFKIAASCIVFLIYIAPIFINMPQQCCCFFLWLFVWVSEKNQQQMKEGVSCTCPLYRQYVVVWIFATTFALFSPNTHTNTHASQCVRTSVCYSLQHIHLFDLFYSLSNFFFWTNRKIWLWRAIPGFQYNYKHTPPSIYV